MAANRPLNNLNQNKIVWSSAHTQNALEGEAAMYNFILSKTEKLKTALAKNAIREQTIRFYNIILFLKVLSLHS